MRDPNSIQIVGRLTADPELKETPSGTPICTFVVANNGQRNGKSLPPVFIPVTLWDKQATALLKVLHKGDTVHVQGQLVDDNYTDKETGKKTNGRLRIGGNVEVTVLKYANPKPQDETPEVQPEATEEVAA